MTLSVKPIRIPSQPRIKAETRTRLTIFTLWGRSRLALKKRLKNLLRRVRNILGDGQVKRLLITDGTISRRII
jgi:hypothetical protein